MIVTKQHIETFKAAYYNNTADEADDPVEIALAAVFAQLQAVSQRHYVNNADGKSCLVVAADSDGVTFKWVSDTLRYLGSAEFERRFTPAPQADVRPTEDLRKRVMRAIFDPGATEGYKGKRDLTTWQTDAVMRALAATEGSIE